VGEKGNVCMVFGEMDLKEIGTECMGWIYVARRGTDVVLF
jgi:hypothetical protein